MNNSTTKDIRIKDIIPWQSWGDDLFTQAKKEKKLVLLFLLDSEYHWSKLMIQENFTNESIAQRLNPRFLFSKLERNENSEVDTRYQDYYKIMTGTYGGWPLTIFLSPEKQLLHIDRYIPSADSPYLHEERVAFSELSLKIYGDYQDTKDSGITLHESLQSEESYPTEVSNQVLLDQVNYLCEKTNAKNSKQLEHTAQMDRLENRTSPATIIFLLNAWYLLEGKNASAMYGATKSLTGLLESGLYDNLSGGFFQHGYDETLRVPRFDKYLSTNTQFLSALSIAFNLTQRESYFRAAKNTGNFILTQLAAQFCLFGAGRFSASTEGEGRPYLWKKEEYEDILDEENLAVFEHCFNTEPTELHQNMIHLYPNNSLRSYAYQHKINYQFIHQHHEESLALLAAARNKKPQPPLDKRCTLANNALTARSFLEAGRYLFDKQFSDLGLSMLSVIRRRFALDGIFKQVVIDDTTYGDARLDDCAHYLEALIFSLQIKWDTDSYLLAITLADHILTNFQTDTGALHHGTVDPGTPLELITTHDSQSPNSQAVVARALMVLALLSGNDNYREVAEAILASQSSAVEQPSNKHNTFILSHHQLLHPPEAVIITGGSADECKQWHEKGLARFNPNRHFFLIPSRVKAPLNKVITNNQLSTEINSFVFNHKQYTEPSYHYVQYLKTIEDSVFEKGIHFSL